MSDFKEFKNPWSADNSEWFGEEKDKWAIGGNNNEWLQEKSSSISTEINGHLFEDDGFYLGKWGETNGCFVIKKGTWRKEKNKDGKTVLIYKPNDVEQLIDLDNNSIQLDTVLKFASIVYDEAGATTEFYTDTILAIACANRNFLKTRNTYYPLVTYKNLANKEKISNYAFGKNTWIKKADNENLKYVFTIGTIIYILTDNPDITNGSVKWDGADLAWKGYTQRKPQYEGIDFKETDFNNFKEFYTSERIKKYTKLDKEFNSDFVSGKYPAVTGDNKDRVLHLSNGFVGNTIFWKPNYFAEENDAQYEERDGKMVKIKNKYNFKYYFYG